MRNVIRVAGIILGVCAAPVFGGDSGAGRVPVLLELFTSEGCSSCPPADRLLEKLDREQGIAGADVIVLSEHVDYWNQLGWEDPFSSPLYSERQRVYAHHLNGDTYTPELVVDGVKGFVGSDQREAERSIRDAARQPKAPVRIKAERADKKTRITLHVDGVAEGTLYLVLAHDAMKSNVLAGENAGRGLSHVGVAYEFDRVAKIDKGKAADFERTVALKPGAATRVVAFVAHSGTGKIVALGQIKL